MNFIQKKQLKRNVEAMESTTKQCAEFMNYLMDHVELPADLRSGCEDVVKHLYNMGVFLSNISAKV